MNERSTSKTMGFRPDRKSKALSSLEQARRWSPSISCMTWSHVRVVACVSRLGESCRHGARACSSNWACESSESTMWLQTMSKLRPLQKIYVRAWEERNHLKLPIPFSAQPESASSTLKHQSDWYTALTRAIIAPSYWQASSNVLMSYRSFKLYGDDIATLCRTHPATASNALAQFHTQLGAIFNSIVMTIYER